MKALKNMSDEELMKEWTKLGAEVQKGRERLLEFKEEHDHRLNEEAARVRFESMNDEERAALAQVMKVEGIKSKEKVSDNG